jgi:hypothetical protein
MVGFSVVRPHFKNTPVKGFRLNQLSGSMRLNPVLNDFVKKYLRQVRLGTSAFFPSLCSSHLPVLTFLCSVH